MAHRKKEEDLRTVHDRQRDFLTAYSDTFNIDRAAEEARVSRACHYRWCRKHPKYAAAFAKRKEEAFHFLESEAIARAGEGWLEPIFYQGSECGQVRRFDSGLIQFLLRGMAPQKYGNKTEISGPQGEPVQARIEVVFVKPDDPASD